MDYYILIYIDYILTLLSTRIKDIYVNVLQRFDRYVQRDSRTEEFVKMTNSCKTERRV